MQHDHEYYMQKCIALAKAAKERGDSPVGSIIVQHGKIIAAGIEGGKTFNDITHHSEIESVRHAIQILKSSDLSDCTLYTTHEPCIMCSYVIRHHKINTVVIGITSGEIGGFSSVYPVLTDTTIKKWGASPTIIEGILKNECLELNA